MFVKSSFSISEATFLVAIRKSSLECNEPTGGMYEKTSCTDAGTELDGWWCRDGARCPSQNEQDWNLPCAWNNLLQPNQALHSLQVAARLFEGWWKDAKEMKKLLLISFILLSISNVFASSKWVFATQTTSNDVIFVDVKSFKKSGNSVTFWFMLNYGSRTSDGVLSSKNQATVNCKTSEMINRYISLYDDNYNKGEIILQGNPDDKWAPIALDSLNWGVYKLVCNK